MKFRKIAAFAAALTMCAALFAGCGKDAGTGEAETTTTSQTKIETEKETETETTLQTEEIADENTDVTEESAGETDGEEASGSILLQAADAALADASWPALERLEDPDFIADFFLLDAANANYKDLLVLKCPMSANLSELIIIEAEDVSAAEADLDARRTKAVENDAWYPDDVEKAGASIVGTEGSFAYFIMGDSPESVEAALVEFLKSA